MCVFIVPLWLIGCYYVPVIFGSVLNMRTSLGTPGSIALAVTLYEYPAQQVSDVSSKLFVPEKRIPELDVLPARIVRLIL